MMKLEEIKEMENLCEISKIVEHAFYSELSKGISNASKEELEVAADIIKDIAAAKESDAKAMYYCTLSKAMEEHEEDYGETWDKDGRFYTEPKRRRERMTPERYHHIEDMTGGRMYYTEPENMGNEMNDMRTGDSWKQRVKYYETKETGDTSMRMDKLEKYTDSLSTDIMEMMNDATENERQMMRTKLQVMAQRI